ncbi:hypothetical protein E2C01_075546 [Portunus trituberculatus]|uniref:Uncharacterized protein n=1 Tax=Portunus trituberculatus TaxID=210409 RepID=A0A5B7IJE9_PORTR|nr:hypothetical protein [Portunus trituberculatus]
MLNEKAVRNVDKGNQVRNGDEEGLGLREDEQGTQLTSPHLTRPQHSSVSDGSNEQQGRFVL